MTDALALSVEAWKDSYYELRDDLNAQNKACIEYARKLDLLRAQLDWSARHPHVRGERHAEGAHEALEAARRVGS